MYRVKNKAKKRISGALAVIMLLTAVFGAILTIPEQVEAASSYTNAIAFYNSTGSGGDNGGSSQHIECSNNAVYYGTKANLAANDHNLKWSTIAWEVTFYGGGESISASVKIGGDYLRIIDSRLEGGYQYNLYKVDVSTLIALARQKDSAKADRIFASGNVTTYFTAILVKKYYTSNTGYGTTYSDGKGNYVSGLVTGESGGNIATEGAVYPLSNAASFNVMAGTYTGASIKSWNDSYINVKVNINGSGALTVNFVDRGTALGSVTASPVQSVKMRGVSDLYKKGYHLESGIEWLKQGSSAYYGANASYPAAQIDPRVATESVTVTMEAAWTANTYYVQYEPNGGTGTAMGKQTCRYDSPFTVWNCNYKKRGYKFIGWSLSPIEAGAFGTSTQTTMDMFNTDTSVKKKLKEYITYNFNVSSTAVNLTDQHLATVKLYAVWEPLTCHIELNEYVTPQEKRLAAAGARTLNLEKKEWTPGTEALFEVFNTLWTSTDIPEYTSAAKVNKFSQAVASIFPPTKTGYTFLGYFKTFAGTEQITTAGGKITAGNTTYDSDGTAYGAWNPVTINITFDMNGGWGGSKKTTATYDKPFASNLSAPVKDGYSFKGYYYTDPEGKETFIYNENMLPCLTVSDFTEDVTLKAYWVDDIPPEVSLKLSAMDWTNSPDGIVIVPIASDWGTGLKSVRVTWRENSTVHEVLYYDNISSDAAVYNTYEVYAQLNGAMQSFAHKVEGVYSYTIVAEDMNGNTTETRGQFNKITGELFASNKASYSAPVYYDITAPVISGEEVDGSLSLTITDLKE